MRTKTGLLSMHAHCNDCEKDWYEKNALGVGARHAKKYNHTVLVEITNFVMYEPNNTKPQSEG